MKSSGPRSLGLAPRTEKEDGKEDAGCAEDEELRSHSEKQISQRRLTDDPHEQMSRIAAAVALCVLLSLTCLQIHSKLSHNHFDFVIIFFVRIRVLDCLSECSSLCVCVCVSVCLSLSLSLSLSCSSCAFQRILVFVSLTH
jgi:hypothetical protein